jgi:hypothetical protein
MRESSLSENEFDESFEDPSQANLEETLDEGLYIQDSLWNRKKKYIETRPKNWLSRFTQDYVPVIPPISPKVEPKEVHYKVVSLTEPEKPKIYQVDDLKPFNDVTLQSNFCLVCWKLVIIGPTRIKCLHCPVVVHRYCVTNIHDFFVPLAEQDEKKASPISVKQLSPRKRTPSSNPTLSILSRDILTESHDSQDELRDSPIQSSHLPSLKTTTAFRREKTAKPKTRIFVSSSPATAARRANRNGDDSLPKLSSNGSSGSRSVVIDTRLDDSTREVRWTCPFCIHEVISSPPLLSTSPDWLLRSMWEMISTPGSILGCWHSIEPRSSHPTHLSPLILFRDRKQLFKSSQC